MFLMVLKKFATLIVEYQRNVMTCQLANSAFANSCSLQADTFLFPLNFMKCIFHPMQVKLTMDSAHHTIYFTCQPL